MEDNFAESIKKVRAFAKEILEQCKSKGFTIREVRMLPKEIQIYAENSIGKQLQAEPFLNEKCDWKNAVPGELNRGENLNEKAGNGN